MKVATIIGTRPEIIKLSEIIKLLDNYTEHKIIHTGQNYDFELSKIFFEGLSIRDPDFYLEVAGENLGESIGNIISRSYELLAELKPDAVLLYGDTNSCLAAISAKRLKIPVVHLEAGNRSFDENVPEEINRRIVDHISDINFPLTERARSYLLKEGIRGDRIIKTGGFMKEIIQANQHEIDNSVVLKRLNLKKKKYFVASVHREENVDDERKLKNIAKCFQVIVDEFNQKIIFSCHPRTLSRLTEFNISLPEQVAVEKPFSFVDYMQLQKNASCVVSDSGTITEEADILGVPAITPRLSHERPEGFDSGVVIMTGLDPALTAEAIKMQIEIYGSSNFRPKVADYQAEKPSLTVLKSILSYVEYINLNVWKKATPSSV